MRRPSKSLPADTADSRAGEWAEDLARRHLEASGLSFITANYHEKGGEIDLVMREGSEVVFVEVRQRAGGEFGTPAETIGPAKLARIVRTARLYLLRRHGSEEIECRFDAVLVTGTRSSCRVEHLRGIVG